MVRLEYLYNGSMIVWSWKKVGAICLVDEYHAVAVSGLCPGSSRSWKCGFSTPQEQEFSHGKWWWTSGVADSPLSNVFPVVFLVNFFFQPSSYWKFEWWPMLGVAESGPGNHVHVSQNIQLLTIRFGSKQNHNIHPHLLMRLYETISNSREIEITKFFGDWFSSLKCFGFWPTGNMGFCSKSATKNLRTKNPERHQTRSRSTCT